MLLAHCNGDPEERHALRGHAWPVEVDPRSLGGGLRQIPRAVRRAQYGERVREWSRPYELLRVPAGSPRASRAGRGTCTARALTRSPRLLLQKSSRYQCRFCLLEFVGSAALIRNHIVGKKVPRATPPQPGMEASRAVRVIHCRGILVASRDCRPGSAPLALHYFSAVLAAEH